MSHAPALRVHVHVVLNLYVPVFYAPDVEGAANLIAVLIAHAKVVKSPVALANYVQTARNASYVVPVNASHVNPAPVDAPVEYVIIAKSALCAVDADVVMKNLSPVPGNAMV